MSKIKSKGFTLLEVIIALGLVASVASGVMIIFARGVARSIYIEEDSQAYILAESKMDEVMLQPTLDDVTLSGSFENDYYRYNIELTPQDYPGEKRKDELIHVQLTVSWGEGEDTNSIEIESLKLEAIDE